MHIQRSQTSQYVQRSTSSPSLIPIRRRLLRNYIRFIGYVRHTAFFSPDFFLAASLCEYVRYIISWPALYLKLSAVCDSKNYERIVCLVWKEYLHAHDHDTNRSTSKEPFSLATKGLKHTLEKLGSINKRHVHLVRRVDALEASSSSSLCVDNRSLSVSAVSWVCW